MGPPPSDGTVITTLRSSEEGSGLLSTLISKVVLVPWSMAMLEAVTDGMSAIASTETGWVQVAESFSIGASVMIVTVMSKSASEWLGALTCNESRAALTSASVAPWIMMVNAGLGTLENTTWPPDWSKVT